MCFEESFCAVFYPKQYKYSINLRIKGLFAAFMQKKFEVKKASSLSYDVGDTVKHIKFGTGVVKSIVDGGRDYEVTVDFEKAGVKKMFASFAKLKKL